jgi:hypothetical protein
MEQIKLAYVAERDIDLLLLEEINVNPDFASWLCGALHAGQNRTAGCTSARHSVTHPAFGESDLVVIYEDGLALLIENKIDAPSQPDQALRYRRRGEEGCREKRWQRFLTCILAPQRYLDANAEVPAYDASLSYESVRDWFKAQANARSDYRADVLSEAIDPDRSRYIPIPNDDVTQFWAQYWMLANEAFPALNMRDPGSKPANSDWPDFRPAELGKTMNIVHKMAQGHVDLQLRNAADKLHHIRGLVREADLQVDAAGKSAAIRVTVPIVDRFQPFPAQVGRIVLALEAAQRLLHLAREMRSDFP